MAVSEEKAKTAYHYYEYPELQEKFVEFITKTVTKYKDDERIFCWNLYNEPGITLGDERASKVLTKVHQIVSEINPTQPLTADIWRGYYGGKFVTKVEELAFELSDVISFHSYSRIEKIVESLHFLQKLNRPIFLTEWLNRILHNNVAEVYPILYMNNIANYCWGFVLGKTQTNEPWDSLWAQYDNGTAGDYDFTKWMHDLFRPNLRPYDPKEIELIEKFNRLAKEEGR